MALPQPAHESQCVSQRDVRFQGLGARPLEGDAIGVEEMKAAGLLRKKEALVKILGVGEISRAVTVRAHAFSGTAREKIEAAGGSVETLER